MTSCCAICKEYEQQTHLSGKCKLTNSKINDSTDPKEACALGKPQLFSDGMAPIADIDVNFIEESAFVMRQLDNQVVSDLVLNIKEHGLLQPIMLRRKSESGKFEIVFGRHRLEACKRLGFKKISAIIKELTEEEATFLQIIENIQRNNKEGIIKQGIFYARLSKRGLSTREIGKRIGKSGVYVQDCLSVATKLHPELRSLIEQRKILPSMAHRIAELPPDRQLVIASRVLNENWRIKDFELNCRERIIHECRCLMCPTHGSILQKSRKHPPAQELYFAGVWIRRRSNIEEEACAFCGKTIQKGDYSFPLKFKGNLTALEACEECAIPRLPEEFVKLFGHYREIDPFMIKSTKMLKRTFGGV